MTKKILIASLSAFLFINAVLVIFNRDKDGSRVTGITTRASCTSCNTQNSAVEVTPRPRSTVNYSQTATETPHISWTGVDHNATLSRLGNQLKLDYTRDCPRGSIMLDTEWRKFIPEHLDCPSLFIVGARKAGTTSLYTYVSRHPEFEGIRLDCGPQAGETFFFSANYGKEDWEWGQYMKLFEQVRWYMTGDSSVGNLVNCKVPQRIWRSCGKQAKIIILLRNPITRFESNFLMRIRLGNRSYNNNTKASTVVEVELENFLRATLQKGVDLRHMEQSWERLLCLFHPSRSLIFEGLYYIHIMNWLCNFPPENILILNSEEFFRDTPKIFEQVIQFLGLPALESDTAKFITSTVYNQGTGARKDHQHLSELDRNKLMAIYKHTNQPLLHLLSWENVSWS